MASRLLVLVFGNDWYGQRVKFRADNPDEWMLNGDDVWLSANPVPNDVRRSVHACRVVRLADALFTLIHGRAEGLDSLKARFLTCPTKPCFMEAEVASLFVCNGFHVKIIKESGKRGEDFDLLATRDGKAVSIEVTSKLGGILTAQTIENTLRAKRDQVSQDRPAVLYMHVPLEWMPDTNTIPTFDDAIVDFMKRSRRFNAIVFFSEKNIPFLNGALTSQSMRACFNERPRHPFEPRTLFEPALIDGKRRMAFSFLERLRNKRTKLQDSSEGSEPEVSPAKLE
jgi:hypothetical protein